MSTRRLLLVAAASAALGFTASTHAWSWGAKEQVKPAGQVVTEARALGAFDGISLAGNYRVLVSQGANSSVEVKADKNYLPLIETRVVEGSKGRTLEITTKKGYNLSGREDPVITLVMPQLRSVAIAGSGDVRVETMKASDLNVSIGGSGDVEFVDLSSDSLNVQVAGSGDVKASGRTSSLILSVAGSGDINARGLRADEVKASIAGSGNATVNAVNTLKVSIAGSGDIAYVGSPKVSSSIVGYGLITKLN